MSASTDCAVLILAAGKGTRMRSKLPKVLHPIAQKPMLAHVLTAAKALNPTRLAVVVGHEAEQIKEAFADEEITWVEQSPQLGTGHAVQCAMPAFEGLKGHRLLILNGDVPLIRQETLEAFLHQHISSSYGVTVLSCSQQPPTGYGRIVRNKFNGLEQIVEEKDADAEIRKIEEINSGTYCVDLDRLPGWLNRLTNENAQQEYYLTDIIAFANADKGQEQMGSGAHCHHDSHELSGVNNRAQLAELNRRYRDRIVHDHMVAGVTFEDPSSCWVAADATIGQDSHIAPHVVIGPGVTLGEDCQVGSFCELKESTIGAGVTIAPFSHLEKAEVADGCTIGPYARLRPAAKLHAKAKVGNFCEVKKATIGEGSKVNHLSYIGDAVIGAGANIGAGTITCNYDGVNKHLTEIGDGVFIGSDTQLVAPVKIGAGAFVAAGSTVTQEVPADALAISRVKQSNILNWAGKQWKKLRAMKKARS
uniref:Bifunctional protein GlmU n=1 Tax=Magnetococcus massalia (strain MO-1) TaxID=451514 RepID=A0A1S7LNB5_MAGMO|nr:bifunctional: N-acetyl glucosamine-1-phosphate uridyltransferase (N-terminal); glucosamine-1-phosphate acetyl transferase (C-terminal) [Candidatus Magnetococcus massalia]